MKRRLSKISRSLYAFWPCFSTLLICCRSSSHPHDSIPACCQASSHSESSVPSAKDPRIVVVGIPLYLDILKAYGDLKFVVATVDSPDNILEVFSLPKVGTPLFPHVEAVLMQNPDIVLGVVEPLKSQLPSRMRKLSGEKMIRSLADLKALIQEVGEFLQKPKDHIDEIVKRLDSQILIQEKAVKFCEPVSVAFVFPSAEGDLYTVGLETIENELLTIAKGKNLLAETSLGKPIPIEALLQKDPSLLLTDLSTVEKMMQDPRLSQLQAVRHRQVVGVRMADFVSLKAPQALAFLIQTLHSKSGSLKRGCLLP